MSNKTSKLIWTDKRTTIKQTLLELSNPILAQLYENTVNGIAEYAADAATARFDLMHISHNVRELINSLPVYLGEDSTEIGNYSGKERAILSTLRERIISDCDECTFKIDEKSNVTPIPSSVAKALDTYREVAVQGRSNSRRKDSLAALGYTDEHDPSLITWRKAKDFFLKYVHLGNGGSQLPSREELKSNFTKIENALSVRLGFFFDAKKALLNILGEANALDGNSNHKEPTRSEVEQALSNIGNPHLRFVFFSGLENPEWIVLLNELDVFAYPPSIDENNSTYRAWPESLYLKKTAPKKPVDTTDILLNVALHENPVTRNACIEIASLLPIEQAARIAESAASWAKEDFCINSHFWATDDLPSLISRLLESDDKPTFRAGRHLLHHCFIPRSNIEDPFSEIMACMPSSYYAEYFPQVINRLAPRARCAELTSFAEALFTKESRLSSDFLVPEIEKAIEDSISIKNVIVCQLVNAYTALLDQSQSNFVKALCKASTKLATRCGLYVITNCINGGSANGGELEDSLNKYVHDFVLSDAICDGEYDSELYPLIRSAVDSNLIAASEINRLIANSYCTMVQKYKDRIQQSQMITSADPEKRARKWQHRALFLIGPESLDDEGQDLYRELSEEFGESRYLAPHAFDAATITGPNSPLQIDEMLSMSGCQLLTHLRKWHPASNDHFQLISHEGQGRILEQVIQADVFKFANELDSTLTLRPTYQRAILSGLVKALRAEKPIPLDYAVQIADHASKFDDNATYPSEGDAFDDDANYQGLKRETGEFLNEILKVEHARISEQNYSTILDAAMRLASSTNPNAEDEGIQNDNDMDPFTLSINTIRPIALRALARWTMHNPNNKRTKEALGTFLAHCPNYSSSRADAAAVGEMVPVLAEFAPSWLNDHFTDLFGADEVSECQQIVITTTLALFWPSPELLEILRPALENALRHNSDTFVHGIRIPPDHNCTMLIGNWLYKEYAMGSVPTSDPLLQLWWDSASDEQIGMAINHLCHLLEQSPDASDEIANRVGSFWDYHKNSLAKPECPKAVKGIAYLIESKRYSPDWWGERLCEELTINPARIPIVRIENDLILLSETDPNLAVKALRLILKNDPTPYSYVYQDVAVTLLQAIKRANNGRLTKEALRCRDLLGSIGCVELDNMI